jgi:hypothetical protein
VVTSYLLAKRRVIAAGYEDEISWQEDAKTRPLTERRFLRESAWVVLSAGLRESVVRSRFPLILSAFHGLEKASSVVTDDSSCTEVALSAFNSRPKIHAIVGICRHVHELGFGRVEARLRTDGVSYLQTLPFIGPVTSWHLAKNLGFSVAKPDRHLCRIAALFKYDDVAGLCDDVGGYVGDDPAVVDVVLWRFSTLERDYLRSLESFAGGSWLPPEPESLRKSA